MHFRSGRFMHPLKASVAVQQCHGYDVSSIILRARLYLSSYPLYVQTTGET